MKQFNRVVVSVFSKPEENAEALKQGLLKLIPFDMEQEKLQVHDKKATGFNNRTIHIYSIELTKERHIKAFMESFLGKLNQQQKIQLANESESRLDNENIFFIRIEKDLWVNDGVVQLTEAGNCYHLKLHIAAFPARKEIALGIATKVFKPS